MGDIIATDNIKTIDDLTKSFNDWSKIHKLIKEYGDKLKELKQKLMDIQKNNIEFMKINDLDHIELAHDETVKLVFTRNKLSNITKQRLPSKLETYFQQKKHMDHDKAAKATKDILEFLEEDPVYVESQYLKKYERD